MRIIRVGDRYTIANEEVKTFDLLPVQTYLATFNPMEGFSLKVHPDLEIKEKIYGVHDSKVKKVINSFRAFERNLGIILSGDKGIGKSVFARMMCKNAIEKGYPVIIVDEANQGLARFIESIDQECVILFDEFDKTFSKHDMGGEQSKLLSLFDGTAGGKKMFIVTCNELYGLNQFIVNRPGRFHYHIRFGYPKTEEIREYLQDKLEKEYYGEINKVIAFAARVNLNYDCLRAIAFELNQGISFKEAIVDLNILNMSPENYEVYLYLDNGEVLHLKDWHGFLFGVDDEEQQIHFWRRNKENLTVEFKFQDLFYDFEKQATIIPGSKLKLYNSDITMDDDDDEFDDDTALLGICCDEDEYEDSTEGYAETTKDYDAVLDHLLVKENEIDECDAGEENREKEHNHPFYSMVRRFAKEEVEYALKESDGNYWSALGILADLERAKMEEMGITDYVTYYEMLERESAEQDDEVWIDEEWDEEEGGEEIADPLDVYMEEKEEPLKARYLAFVKRDARKMHYVL
mgnify:CR=1 FL=1